MCVCVCVCVYTSAVKIDCDFDKRLITFRISFCLHYIRYICVLHMHYIRYTYTVYNMCVMYIIHTNSFSICFENIYLYIQKMYIIYKYI